MWIKGHGQYHRILNCKTYPKNRMSIPVDMAEKKIKRCRGPQLSDQIA